MWQTWIASTKTCTVPNSDNIKNQVYPLKEWTIEEASHTLYPFLSIFQRSSRRKDFIIKPGQPTLNASRINFSHQKSRADVIYSMSWHVKITSFKWVTALTKLKPTTPLREAKHYQWIFLLWSCIWLLQRSELIYHKQCEACISQVPRWEMKSIFWSWLFYWLMLISPPHCIPVFAAAINNWAIEISNSQLFSR